MAVENRYQIEVNMKSRMFREVPEVVANDKVIFEITVYDGPQKFPLSETYTYHLTSLKLGGQSVIREGSLSGEVIVFELGTSEMTVPGKVEGTVQIFDENNDRISSSKFDYVVKRDPSLQGSLPADNTSLIIANESLLTSAVEKSDTAITDSSTALTKAAAAETTANQVKSEFDQVVAEAGSNNPEVVQARGEFVNLKARIDHTDEVLAQNATYRKNIAVDVTEYGAKGDGVIDDTQAFIDAINYLTSVGGGKLKVPNGTFLANFELPSDVTIEGNGVKNTTIKSVPNSNKDVIRGVDFDLLSPIDVSVVSEGVRRSSVENLTVDGNKENNSGGCGIKIWGCYISLKDIFVMNCAEDGIVTQFSTHKSPTVSNVLDTFLESVFRNIKIAYCRNGWVYNGPHDSLIDNLIIVKCDEWGFKQRDKWSYVVANNWNFWLNGNGIQVGTGLGGSYIVSNNDDRGIGLEFLPSAFQSVLSNVRMTGYSQGIVLNGGYHSINGTISSCNEGVVVNGGRGFNIDLVAISNPNLFTINSEGGTNRFIVQSLSSTNILSSTSKNFRSDDHVEINTGNRSANNIYILPHTSMLNGGWTQSFPLSNGTILTDKVAPTSTARGGVLKQSAIADLTTQPTMEDFNNLLTKLRSAGILS